MGNVTNMKYALSTSSNTLKLTAIISNQYGQYVKAKLKKDNKWVDLIVKDDPDTTNQIQNHIHAALSLWQLSGKKIDYIVVPAYLFCLNK